MKFECQLTKKDVRKYWGLKHWVTDLLYLALFTFFFLLVNAPLIKDNLGVFLLTYLIYAVGIFLLLFFVNWIFIFIQVKRYDKLGLFGTYSYTIDEEKMVETGPKGEISVTLNELKGPKIRKNSILWRSKKGSLSFLFLRSTFPKQKQFDQLKERLLEGKEEEKVLI